ncbi:hypothetical protein [Methanopyrus sp.]
MTRKVWMMAIVGLQEALFETQGRTALALNRVAGQHVLELFEEEGLLKVSGEDKDSLSDDIVEVLGHTDGVKVRVEGSRDRLEIIIEQCPFDEVRRKLLDLGKCPVVCPYAATILAITEMTFDSRYRLAEIDFKEDACTFALERS